MPPTPSSPSTPSNIQRTARTSLGAFALSVIIHLTVILLVGGYVVFEGVVPQAPFVAVEGVVVPGDLETMPEPDFEPEGIDMPNVSASEFAIPSADPGAEGEPTSSDILVSPVVSSFFNLAPAVGPPSQVPRIGTGGGGPGGTGVGGGGSGGPGGGRGNIVKSLFGSSEAAPSTLRGTMYDLKQDRNGSPLKSVNYNAVVRQFSAKFDESVFDRFFKVKNQLFATHIYIPRIKADAAPEAFQVADQVKPSMWVILYEGRFAAPETKRYRFVGYADDVLLVSVNGRLVLDGSFGAVRGFVNNRTSDWQATPETLAGHTLGRGFAGYGDWIDFEAGKLNDIRILIGEHPGGSFSAVLFIQEDGKRYERDSVDKDRPLLPLFRVQDVRVEIPGGMSPADAPRFAPRGPVFQGR